MHVETRIRFMERSKCFIAISSTAMRYHSDMVVIRNCAIVSRDIVLQRPVFQLVPSQHNSGRRGNHLREIFLSTAQKPNQVNE